MSQLDILRYPIRTLGFVGLTFSLYGCLEVDTAFSPNEERNPVLYKWMQRYGKGLLSLFGVDCIAKGKHVDQGIRYPGTDDRGLGRMFVMNHRSMLDIFITLAFIEATIVSRSDLAGWPVIGVAARRVGTLFVDRSSKSSGAAVIDAMCGAIERGRAVMVYPEGTTYAGDEVRAFKPGAFLAAKNTGAEIVPVGLCYGGPGASFGDEPFSEHMKRVATAKRTPAAIVVGEGFSSAGMSVDDLRDKSRGEVQRLVHAARRALGE